MPPNQPAAAFARAVSRRWAERHRLGVAGLVLLALAPVVFVLWSTAEGRRDLVYWDEFDTALALVVKLKEGMTPGEFAREIFALNNEHRMVTSRLLFAASFWLTGTINFTFLHWVGVTWVFLLCGILLVAARQGMRRLRLALILAGLLFQLEHYENYLWSGSSIDHFQVVMLAAGAIFALTLRPRRGVAIGGLLASLATFTLAHGVMVWPAGAAMLWLRRERRAFALWCALGTVVVASFLIGFKVNSAESFASVSLAGAGQILRYWLAILGAVPALGQEALEPALGAGLLLLLGLAVAQGALRRERTYLLLVLFAVAAAALIAVGRAVESGGEVHSRYYILGAVAWGLTLFMLLERHTHPRRPWRVLVAVLPALALFNVAADAAFMDETESWLESRNRAVTRFKQYGIDGRGPFTLHPNPEHATELLRRAEELGVYRLGPISQRRAFPADAVVNPSLAYFVDEMTVNPRSLFLRGWVAAPGRTSERGQIHLILRSGADTHLFTTVSISRPDVAQATHQPGWELSGFRFARRRDRLPTGEYQIGFLLTGGGRAEYTLTAHRVRLVGEGQALLATGN